MTYILPQSQICVYPGFVTFKKNRISNEQSCSWLGRGLSLLIKYAVVRILSAIIWQIRLELNPSLDFGWGKVVILSRI